MRVFVKILIALIIFWLWSNLATYYYVCKLKGICNDNDLDKDSIALSKIPKTLSIKVDGIPVLENYPEFIFQENIDTIYILNKQNDFLNQVSLILKSQPNARLLVKGLHNAGEEPSIAEKRAAFIIDKLVKRYEVQETSVLNTTEMKKDSNAIGLAFELLGYLPNSELLIAREDSIFRVQWSDSLTKGSYNGILAAFDNNSSELKLSPKFNLYCDSLIVFLKSRPGATIYITGHCDSYISDNEAEKAALHFANLCVEYFKKLGIKNKITTISKGKKELIANDSLLEQSPDLLSIAKNRRVEIIIKDLSATNQKKLISKNKIR